MNLLEKEVQKTHIEVATLKAKNASLERDYMEKDKQCNQLSSKCAYLEKVWIFIKNIYFYFNIYARFTADHLLN